MAWMFPFHSMLQPIFDQYMFEISEAGLVDRIQQFYRPMLPTCSAEKYNEVDFNFVLVVFGMLGVGVVLAVIVFVLELFGFEVLSTIWPKYQ